MTWADLDQMSRCKRGHLYKRMHRQCSACRRERRGTKAHRVLLPASPLVSLIVRTYELHVEPVSGWCGRFRSGPRQLARMWVRRYGGDEANVTRRIQRYLYGQTSTVDLAFADQLCVLLGRHPYEVYGELWWEAA